MWNIFFHSTPNAAKEGISILSDFLKQLLEFFLSTLKELFVQCKIMHFKGKECIINEKFSLDSNIYKNLKILVNHL